MENSEKQLELIVDMINSARKEFSDDSFHYLIWGWAVCIAALAQYVLMQVKYDNIGIVWLIVIPLAIAAQIIFSVLQKKKEKVRSHMDKVLGYVWMAVGFCIAAVLFSMNVLQEATYPILILLYGIGTFISGGIMKLRPMMIGAACCGVIGMVAFHVPLAYQSLLLSLSLILSYIIPGHMLKNRFRKHV